MPGLTRKLSNGMGRIMAASSPRCPGAGGVAVCVPLSVFSDRPARSMTRGQLLQGLNGRHDSRPYGCRDSGCSNVVVGGERALNANGSGRTTAMPSTPDSPVGSQERALRTRELAGVRGPGPKASQPRRRLMMAVLASASAWAEIQAVAGGRRCIRARDQDELFRLAGDVDAVVIEAENLLPVLGVVRHINRDHPLLPVILITEQNSVDLRHLASVSVEAILCQHQIAARLPAALKSSAEVAFRLRRLGEECMRNELIPAPLRRLLGCALISVPPPRTVQHLARLLHSDPSTIRRHWRRDVDSRGIQRVKDLLDWIFLLQALSAKRPDQSWRCVARSIGTHENTLRRLAVRLTGDTLSSVGAAGTERLLECFAESLAESICAKLS